MKKLILPLFLVAASSVSAETLRTAKVTRSINQVLVYPPAQSARPAAIGESVSAPSSVQTGRQSRAELVFPDQTITRLGQNSVFSFRSGGRDVELKQGSVLLQVPKNAGGATIRTATVTAAITGTTSMFEYSPGKWVKLLTLEGTQHLYINGRQDPIAIPAGKMLIMHPDAKVVPHPVDIDLAKLVATSPLAGIGTFGPLPETARNAIRDTIALQQAAKRRGDLLPTNRVITGPGIRNADAVHDAAIANTRDHHRDERPYDPGNDFPNGEFPNNDFPNGDFPNNDFPNGDFPIDSP